MVGGVRWDGGGYADRTERERGLGVNVEIRPIKGIGLAKYNPRKISDQALDSLVQSIERFGFVDPVIVNDRTGILVGGHQRLKAAKKLGLKDVPVVAVNLEEAEEKALNVALNKISGEWDLDLLRGVLEDVQAAGLDLSLTGFSDDEWAAMIGDALNVDSEAKAINPGEIAEFTMFVTCASEAQQQELYNELLQRGYEVKLT
jgi:ParB-like chromosome segregation protein Spo0J